jgi:DNA-binding response OmpR family regulator
MAGLHVLVVDACPHTATTTALMLCLDGHHLQIARDGLMAIAKARADKPDIVLLDIDLPGLSGSEVSRCLRESLCDKPPLIVAVAGHDHEADCQCLLEGGIDLYLVKPLDSLALLGILSRCAKVVA